MALGSALPSAIDALVALFGAAMPNATVSDGAVPSDENAGDYLMVGIDDPTAAGSQTAGDSQQTASIGSVQRPRDEVGTIQCLALSWNGDGNVKAARDAAYALIDTASDIVRAQPDLGLVAALDVPFFVATFSSDARLMQTQDEDGAEAAVLFTISFATRITPSSERPATP